MFCRQGDLQVQRPWRLDGTVSSRKCGCGWEGWHEEAGPSGFISWALPRGDGAAANGTQGLGPHGDSDSLCRGNGTGSLKAPHGGQPPCTHPPPLTLQGPPAAAPSADSSRCCSASSPPESQPPAGTPGQERALGTFCSLLIFFNNLLDSLK